MYIPRTELIDLIVRNNMVEEFVSWIKKMKGSDIEPISLWDIDYDLLYKFVLEKKLIVIEDIPEYVKEAASVDKDIDISFKNIERKNMPKKIRRKT